MPLLLHQLLDRSVAIGPDREAIVDKKRRFTYREFGEAVDAFAGRLVDAGLRRRDRVACYLDKSFEECASIFGASRAGGVFVPVNALLRPAQIVHILEDCGVRYFVTSAKRWATVGEAVSKVPSLERVFFVDEAPAADERFESHAFAPGRDGPPQPACIGEDLAAILYTSGSTGRPKGVMLSHQNLLAGSRIVIEYLSITAEERILSVLPFSFDYGLNQLITTVDRGSAIVLLTFRFGDEIVRAIRAENVTGLAGVPTVWAVLDQAAPTFHKESLPSLRYLTNSGGAVPTRTLDRIRAAQPHIDFFLMYGLTEAFRSTYLPPSEIDRRPTSMGKAIPRTEVFAYHVEEKRLCRPGETGILVHRGPTVSLGYWNRPEDTARVLQPNPLLEEHEGADRVCFSGDLVQMDEDGYFYFIGRNDAMIKSSGNRISPTEVEEVLMSSGKLAQAAVIGLPDPAVGQRVHAVCVPQEGVEVDAQELLSQCAVELPAHMVPRAVEFVDALPKSPNGKVDYKKLTAERAEKIEA